MNPTLGVSAIQKPYTKCNHLVSTLKCCLASSVRIGRKRIGTSFLFFFMYNDNVDSV